MAPAPVAFAPNLDKFLRSLKGNSSLEASIESLIAYAPALRLL